MSEHRIEVLRYAQRFGITPQLAALMQILHESTPLALNEDIQDAMMAFGRKQEKPKRLVDMGIYRLRKVLAFYEIKIHRIENFGAYLSEEDKKRISHALTEVRLQSA